VGKGNNKEEVKGTMYFKSIHSILSLNLLNFSLILGLIGVAFSELSQLLWTIIQLIPYFSSIFKLYIPNPTYSVFDHSSNLSRVDNGFDFINIRVILIHILVFISPVEWLQ